VGERRQHAAGRPVPGEGCATSSVAKTPAEDEDPTGWPQRQACAARRSPAGRTSPHLERRWSRLGRVAAVR
jgi:hypothetical protein